MRLVCRQQQDQRCRWSTLQALQAAHPYTCRRSSAACAAWCLSETLFTTACRVAVQQEQHSWLRSCTSKQQPQEHAHRGRCKNMERSKSGTMTDSGRRRRRQQQRNLADGDRDASNVLQPARLVVQGLHAGVQRKTVTGQLLGERLAAAWSPP